MKYSYILLIGILIISESIFSQTVSKYIVIDQFGYTTKAKKVAVIRDPQTGFDASESFTPGTTYQVINNSTGLSVFSGTLAIWSSGATDASSGDKAWWFDFTAFETPGTYYIKDVSNNVKSYDFDISDAIYNDVLKHAMRSYFYQRCGMAKDAQYAGTSWADAACHIGSLQDKNCRLYNDINNAATEKDLHGGWHDAGDYNKYVNFTWTVLIDLLTAYEENPDVWADNYNIPESNNGIPDVLDEIKWELDWLLRMQQSNGSVLSVVGSSHASPPSAATAQTVYGSVNTSAATTCAGVFALASKVYASLGKPAMTTFADTLKARAIKAWNWANANPSVTFKNNDAASGTSGLAAGQQELTDPYDLANRKVAAACFLYAITNNATYKTFFESNYSAVHLIAWTFAYPFETRDQDILLYYTKLPGITASVGTAIKSAYKSAIEGGDNKPKYGLDPYLASLKDYVWGSNGTKSCQGIMFYDVITYNIDAANISFYKNAAQGYINYIHGVNPLQKCYLSNMGNYGAENSVMEFYNGWFQAGSAKWDRVGTSTYGPAPGYLPGGSNPSYAKDACCSSSCSSQSLCSVDVSSIVGQPNQKSYKDFNDGWPLNSWEVTENGIYYQSAYIKLLSKFVSKPAATNCVYPSLGTDKSICGLASINLNSSLTSTGKTFKWYKDNVVISGQTGNTLNITQAGTYKVDVDTAGCVKSDDVVITGTLSVDLGADKELCNPSEYTLDAANSSVPNIVYTWSTSANTQTILINKAGTYIVTVSAINCPSVNDAVVITSKLLNVTADTLCNSGTAVLTVNGSGNYTWYDVATGGASLGVGITYNPSIVANKTFYVEEAGGVDGSLGKTVVGTGATWSLATTAFSGTDKINKVTVLQAVTLKSVSVYVENANTAVTINLKQGTTTMYTKTIAGLAVGKQVIPLSFNVSPGVYTIDAIGTNNSLTYECSGGVFPYSYLGYISFTYNENWQSEWYGLFYDWKISAGSACLRTPVNAVIDPLNLKCLTTIINHELSESNSFSMYPNPANGELIVTASTPLSHRTLESLSNAVTEQSRSDNTITITNTLGQVVYSTQLNNEELKINTQKFESGIYYVRFGNKMGKLIINK